MRPAYRFRPLVMVACLAAMLSGCGGGSNTRMDTDTGMRGGGQTLTIAEGLTRSTATPVYATSADSFESAGLETLYPALSANVTRNWNESTVTLGSSDGDLHLKSIAGDYDAVGGDEEIVVTYEFDDGEVLTVSFTTDDYDAEEGSWHKQIEGADVWFWFNTGRREFRHYASAGGDSNEDGVGVFSHSTIGARTEAANMPAGTATYYGRARADSWLKDEPGSNPNRQRIDGALRLTADFAGSTLDGRITDIQVRKGNESSTDWPETTYLAIDEGQIVDGQFTAKLTGMDSNANAPMDESLSGYKGDVLGEFYGPAAEEVGGVFNASRDDRVMIGWLGGAQLNPDRLAGSARTAVSVGVDLDFPASTSQLTDAASVTAVESDGADGFYVTYMVDGAAERIHLPMSVYDPVDKIFETEGPPDYGIWEEAGSYRKSAEFDHFSVNGWYVYNYETAPNGSVTPLNVWRGHMVYGESTAVLPAGTAEYAGRVFLNGWSRTDPASSARERFQSSLALTADFDNRTITGLLDDWSFRGPDDSGYEDINAEMVIQNGTITNNELSAELVGRHDAAGITGNMAGQFFGPGAAEVGGVIDAEDSDSVFEGWFGGKKQ